VFYSGWLHCDYFINTVHSANYVRFSTWIDLLYFSKPYVILYTILDNLYCFRFSFIEDYIVIVIFYCRYVNLRIYVLAVMYCMRLSLE